MKILDSYFHHLDIRGTIRGITQDKWHEVNFVTSVKGSVRGGHYHKKTKELVFITKGHARIEYRDVRDKENEMSDVAVGRNSIILIETYEWHEFYCDTDCEWINMLSCPMKDPKDIHEL